MPEKTMRDAINEALHQAMEQDDSVFVIGEDVAGCSGSAGDAGAVGGVFGVTEGIYHRWPDRCIDTPISESAIVGAAAGAALATVTGGNRTDIARSAALGGAAGTGYAIYRERQNNGTYPNGSYTVAPPTTVPAPTTIPAPTTAPALTTAPAPTTAPIARNYPTAQPTGTPGVVISPHKPYNKIRTTGLRPGQLATDPTTKKIFVVPN